MHMAPISPSPISEPDRNQRYPGLDVEAGIQLWRNADTYRSFLGRFVGDYAPQIEAITTLTQPALGALLHKLTGAAGNLCLPELQHICKEFQATLRTGPDLQAQQASLQAAFACASASIQRYLSDTTPGEH